MQPTVIDPPQPGEQQGGDADFDRSSVVAGPVPNHQRMRWSDIKGMQSMFEDSLIRLLEAQLVGQRESAYRCLDSGCGERRTDVEMDIADDCHRDPRLVQLQQNLGRVLGERVGPPVRLDSVQLGGQLAVAAGSSEDIGVDRDMEVCVGVDSGPVKGVPVDRRSESLHVGAICPPVAGEQSRRNPLFRGRREYESPAPVEQDGADRRHGLIVPQPRWGSLSRGSRCRLGFSEPARTVLTQC
jgi:hypothetical protein